MRASPPDRRQVPLSTRLGFICFVIALVDAGFIMWPRWQAEQRRQGQSATGNTSGKEHAPSPTPDDPARKLREQTAWWKEHKDRLRQLLTVDYPAALARRNAKFPDVAAVVKFGEEYVNNFERQNHQVFLRAEEQDKKYRAKKQKIEVRVMGGIWGDLLLAERWLSNTEPVPGGMTVSDLAWQFWADDPNSLSNLRHLAANAERRISNDEAAAQRVESLQTPQEVVAYVQAARLRWEASQTQINTEAGYDADVSEYLMGSQTAGMLSTLTKDYEKRSHAELDAIGKESDEILQAMHEPELAADSRDDPEARRMLTELREFLRLREQVKGQL